MLTSSNELLLRARLFYIVLFLLSVSCNSIKEVTYSPATLDLWDLLTYCPNSANQIVGEYLYSSGFAGEYLQLDADGSYFQKVFADLLDPADVVDGYSGTYQIRADTLFLTFESFCLKPKQNSGPLQADSLIYSSLYAMLIIPSADSLTYEDRVTKALELQNRIKNNEQYSKYNQSNYYTSGHLKPTDY